MSSRVYDTIEPSVIDDNMLQAVISEQGPKDYAGKIAEEEGVEYKCLIRLRLDFRNILQIDNLWGFKALTKLSLDNNIIEKIEGLSHLINLVWLDLSFNNIEVIEGLDTLILLEDLSLFNNRISKIENLDKLRKLQVLSIGNNMLSELNDLKYLRQFKKLQTLNLSGNPFCKKDNYKDFAIAFLPFLVYLDFRLIDQETKKESQDKYYVDLGHIQEEEAALENELQAQQIREKDLELHKKAYVENLDGHQLFQAMYAEDSDGKKLNKFPGMDEILESFEEKFVECCAKIFELGLKEHKKREEEVDTFLLCINEAKSENRSKSAIEIEHINSVKTELAAKLTTIETSDADMLIQRFSDDVRLLWDKLMGYEVELIDQMEDTIKEFERNMAEMVSGFVEQVQGYVTQLRDLENIHNERLAELSLSLLDKLVKNELEDDIADDAREILVDKDTVSNAVSASHDLHLLAIDNREDDIVSNINLWMTSLIDRIHSDEVERNRNRVTEINHVIDRYQEDIENFTFDIQEGN